MGSTTSQVYRDNVIVTKHLFSSAMICVLALEVHQNIFKKFKQVPVDHNPPQSSILTDGVQKQDFCKVGCRPTFLTLWAYHVFRCKSELSIKTHIFLSDIMSLRMKMLFSFNATCPSKTIFHNSFHRNWLNFSHRRRAD